MSSEIVYFTVNSYFFIFSDNPTFFLLFDHAFSLKGDELEVFYYLYNVCHRNWDRSFFLVCNFFTFHVISIVTFHVICYYHLLTLLVYIFYWINGFFSITYFIFIPCSILSKIKHLLEFVFICTKCI